MRWVFPLIISGFRLNPILISTCLLDVTNGLENCLTLSHLLCLVRLSYVERGEYGSVSGADRICGSGAHGCQYGS